RLAEIVEALDLGAHPADGLHLAELVHAAGDGDALVDAHVGQGREHGEELARAGAVAVDLAVALLERQLRAQAEGPLLPEHAGQVAAQDGDALGVDAAPELRLALDVDDALAADAHDGRDAHRLAELDVAGAEHAEAVDHADPRAVGLEGHLAAQRDLADV